MTEAEMNIDQVTNAAKTIFRSGTAEQRDALRAVANTVLAGSAALAYEGTEPDVETTYRLLSKIQFSGDGQQMLPADEIYALDTLLRKGKKATFMRAVENIALTMYCTDPRTAGRGYWPKNNNDLNLLLTRAFIWLVAQEGLENILVKDTSVVSHTRLAQFLIATQVAGKDEGALRHFTLYHPHQDTGNIYSCNVLPDEYIASLKAARRANRPEEYDQVRGMSFNQLADLCERLNVIGPNSVPKHSCSCDDEDCECEDDDYRSREDYEGDTEELLEDFYGKFGSPDDDEEPEQDIWQPDVSLMEVEIDLPAVTLPRPAPDAYVGRAPSRYKKPVQKTSRTKLLLTREQQIWHTIDTDNKEFGDRRFAITLVSRHTCGVSHAIATAREALAVAAVLMDESSK